MAAALRRTSLAGSGEKFSFATKNSRSLRLGSASTAADESNCALQAPLGLGYWVGPSVG